ncbi:MAG: hypothetical protein JO198_11030 [Candidatus Dormibacteraeota bacterium]|nr:hypothetical protein [Candidatus Dormibacteraeota bacterium]
MIRLASRFRLFIAAWFSVCGIIFVMIFGAEALLRGSWAGAMVALGVLVVLAVVAWRWASLAVTTADDRLVVRQFFSTRVIWRTEIASFRVDGTRRETPGIVVRAVLNDGATVVLGATGWYFRSPAEVKTLCDALGNWLGSGVLTLR